MGLKKSGDGETYLLVGGIEYNDDDRAEILYNHPDNKRSLLSEVMPVTGKAFGTLYNGDAKGVYESGNEISKDNIYNVNNIDNYGQNEIGLSSLNANRTSRMKDLKAERKNRVKEIREKKEIQKKINDFSNINSYSSIDSLKQSNKNNALLALDNIKSSSEINVQSNEEDKNLIENIKDWGISTGKKLFDKIPDKNLKIDIAECFMRNIPSSGYRYARTKGKEAEELFKMSYLDKYLNTPYANKYKQYSSIKELEPDLKSLFETKITKAFGADRLYKIRGIRFDENSELSKKVSEDNTLHNFIRENAYQIRNNEKIEDSSLKFEEANMGNSIGSADIRNIKILDDGSLYLQVIDLYDFDNKNDSSVEILAARRLQDTYDIIPYFSIVDVVIPRQKTKDLLY